MKINFLKKLLNVKTLTLAALITGTAWETSPLWREPLPADLSENPFQLTQTLVKEWQDGDLIVFIRHLERCSRVDAACLAEPSGITQRSVATGLEMGRYLSNLGLANGDIYTSPLTRTKQTSQAIFAQEIASKDFLFKCQPDFFKQALNIKQEGRNLFLVTHSSCLDELTEHFAHAEVDFEYGAAVFVNVENLKEQQVLGFVDADDWARTLSPRT